MEVLRGFQATWCPGSTAGRISRSGTRSPSGKSAAEGICLRPAGRRTAEWQHLHAVVTCREARRRDQDTVYCFHRTDARLQGLAPLLQSLGRRLVLHFIQGEVASEENLSKATSQRCSVNALRHRCVVFTSITTRSGWSASSA